MRKYKSAIYKHLHGEFKDRFEAGVITAEQLREFEQRCFKDTPDASPVRTVPQARAVRRPALAAASPRTEPGR
jgi:putative transcriptional regulator